MKLFRYSLLIFLVGRALGLTENLHQSLTHQEPQDGSRDGDVSDTSFTPFFSTFWEDLFLDQSFSSLSSRLDEMIQSRISLFSNDFAIKEENQWKSLPTHPFLRGRLAFSPASVFLENSQFEMEDTDEKFELSLHLPHGIAKQDVSIEIKDGGTRLVIEGKTQSSNQDGDKGNPDVIQELVTTSFSQSFSIDPRIEFDHLLATIKDGILTVSAPKDGNKLIKISNPILIHDLDVISNTPKLAPPKSSNNQKYKQRAPKSPQGTVLSNGHIPVGDKTTARTEAEMRTKPFNGSKLLPPAKSLTDSWDDVRETSL
ncbi:heat shock protein, Hsp 20 family protein [Nitzschia inconspicua]|uniref:Heat shock protein, Hsp 20 family protein n=1 Tax=Nitzschia inconspicua TaxID=303405 RepID=A0A9K3LUL0_9STRA|nr:heat shock protein, Hsp 20 family protein [Nitzschia inconspicua]